MSEGAMRMVLWKSCVRITKSSPAHYAIILFLPPGRVGDVGRRNATGFCGGDMSAMRDDSDVRL